MGPVAGTGEPGYGGDGGPGDRAQLREPIALPDLLSVTRKGADYSAGLVQAAHPLILNIRDQKTSLGVQKAVVRLP